MSLDVLVVDDESDISALVAEILTDEGYTARMAASGEEAIALVRERRPNLVLLDIWLGESRFDGLKVLDILKADHPNLPVIMMSGHGTIETAVATIKKGAYDFLEKPFQAERLLVMAERALETARLRRENEELREKTLNDFALIGSSGAISQMRDLIKKVAATNSRVFISGPSGAGKETIAHQIHLHSKRMKGPFIVLNCANLDPSHLEEQLFGKESEDSCRVGLLEQAHQGTLYLDEVCDLSLETQGKIVKALQSNVFQRLGGNYKVTVDVRVIASSAQDMLSLIDARAFREDLYYRLNVVPITVIPLSHRLEDIPILAQYFSDRFAFQNGINKKTFSEEVILSLQAYRWPGNVRQLQNVIEWVMIMHGNKPGNMVTAEMLPQEITNNTPILLKSDQLAEVISLPLRDAREKFERDYLLAQVARFSGNISQTASFIGMERSALHRKLKSLAIERFKHAS
jgi:two-component system, NtrC family, nitrogen regulation response regulator NtrX